ncbi:MAG: hypothetical protein WBL95_19855 [Microcoleus sp.]
MSIPTDAADFEVEIVFCGNLLLKTRTWLLAIKFFKFSHSYLSAIESFRNRGDALWDSFAAPAFLAVFLFGAA